MTPERDNDVEVPRGGVLAALPRTRPQRASSRRAAARPRARSEMDKPASAPKRGAARTKAKAKKQTTKKQPATAKKTVRQATVKRRSSVPRPERAPKQGYEPEEEMELGNTVHPPSGGELIESIADIFGELAGAGATAGGRLLRDALSIFRRP
jgi:hypothetical protein